MPKPVMSSNVVTVPAALCPERNCPEISLVNVDPDPWLIFPETFLYVNWVVVSAIAQRTFDIDTRPLVHRTSPPRGRRDRSSAPGVRTYRRDEQ
jgi:hypothetical protein